MTPEAIALLESKLARLREAHVGALLRAGSEALALVKPDRRATVGASLDQLKKGTAEAQKRFGQEVRSEVLSLLNTLKIPITSELKAVVLAVVKKYVDGGIYVERFRLYAESFDRHVARYGSGLRFAELPTEHTQATYDAASNHFVSQLLAALADDLEVLVQRDRHVATATSSQEGRFEQANRLIKLEPNFFGLGVNLNYLIRRLLGRRE